MEFSSGGKAGFAPLPARDGREALALELREDSGIHRLFLRCGPEESGPVRCGVPWLRVRQRENRSPQAGPASEEIQILIHPGQTPGVGNYVARVQVGSRELDVLLRVTPAAPPHSSASAGDGGSVAPPSLPPPAPAREGQAPAGGLPRTGPTPSCGAQPKVVAGAGRARRVAAIAITVLLAGGVPTLLTQSRVEHQSGSPSESASLSPANGYNLGMQSPPRPTEVASEPTASAAPDADGAPEYSRRPLTDEDLRTLDAHSLTLLRNEIFARHGRRFQDLELRAHFEAQPWYRARADFKDSDLSRVERENASFILQFQKRTGRMDWKDW